MNFSRLQKVFCDWVPVECLMNIGDRGVGCDFNPCEFFHRPMLQHYCVLGVMKRAACCWPRKMQLSTSTVEKCRMDDVDQTALFQLVDVSMSDHVHFTALFITPCVFALKKIENTTFSCLQIFVQLKHHTWFYTICSQNWLLNFFVFVFKSFRKCISNEIESIWTHKLS